MSLPGVFVSIDKVSPEPLRPDEIDSLKNSKGRRGRLKLENSSQVPIERKISVGHECDDTHLHEFLNTSQDTLKPKSRLVRKRSREKDIEKQTSPSNIANKVFQHGEQQQLHLRIQAGDMPPKAKRIKNKEGALRCLDKLNNENILTRLQKAKFYLPPKEFSEFITEHKDLIVNEIANDLDATSRKPKDLIDPKFFYLATLHDFFRECNREDILLKIVQTPLIDSKLPDLLRNEILSADKKPLSIWDKLLPLTDYVKNYGEALISAARQSPNGFAKEGRKGKNLPFSIVAFKSESTNEVSLFVTGKVLGQGSYKLAKTLIPTSKNPFLVKASAHRPIRSDARVDFEKEAFISKTLHEKQVPNILKIWQVSSGSRVRNLSEICNRGTLLSVNETLDFSEKLRLVIQLSQAIEGMHKAGYIHMDLKLENVFVTADSNNKLSIRLADFGAAEPWIEAAPKSVSWVGSTFPSPEILNADLAKIPSHITPAIDVWAFGLILFNIKYSKNTTGFGLNHVQGRRNRTAFDAHVNNIHVLLRSSPNGDAYDLLVKDMLSTNPGERPSASEVVSRLVSYAATVHPVALKKNSNSQVELSWVSKLLSLIYPVGY